MALYRRILAVVLFVLLHTAVICCNDHSLTMQRVIRRGYVCTYSQSVEKASSKASSRSATSPSNTAIAKLEVISNELLSENIALDCAINGDVPRLVRCFEDNADAYHEIVGSMVNKRSSTDGKSPLEWASLLGRTEVVTELLKRGAEINSINCKGYGALHLASAWDKIEILKLLVRQGADLYLATANKEVARDIALRYNNNECADFLEWADCRQQLKSAILAVKEQMTVPEKVKLLAKDVKVSTNAVINEKLDWLEKTTDAATADFIAQKELFVTATSPVVKKMNEPPPEKPEKK